MKKVRSKLKSLFITVTSCVIFIGTGFSLFTDVNYFLTKREVFGTILKLRKGEQRGDLEVEVRYFNSYSKQTDTSKILLENSYWDSLKGLNQVRINYSNGSTPTVYLEDIKSPHFAIIFFDLLIMILMGIAFYSGIKGNNNTEPIFDPNHK